MNFLLGLERLVLLKELFAKLPAQHALTLWMHFFHGFTASEMAARTMIASQR